MKPVDISGNIRRVGIPAKAQSFIFEMKSGKMILECADGVVYNFKKEGRSQ